MKAAQNAGRLTTKRRKGLWRTLLQYRYLYLMLVPGILFYIIFCYGPMYGVVIAFQKYVPSSGLAGMTTDANWVGLDNFTQFFNSYYFTRLLSNTIIIFFQKFLTSFPAAILLALLINEVMNTRFKRTVQTVSYLPNFLSMVIVTGIATTLLSPTNGVINTVRQQMGMQSIHFVGSTKYFRSILWIMNLWKGVGWSSIIYLAAFAGIDTELYEYARIEGAGKLQQIWYVTLPSISFIISIQLILSIGGLLSAGFEDILLLYSPTVYSVADVIDTYVYREGLLKTNFSYSTAVGLFKSLIGIVLVFDTNAIAKRLGYEGVW